MAAIDQGTSVHSPSPPSTVAVRIVTWLQVFFWGGYLLVLAKLLIAGILYGGFGFYPFGPDGAMSDPKEVFGWGVPEYILHMPLLVVVFYGMIPAALLLLASLPYAAMLWQARDRRRWPLTVSIIMTLSFLVVQLTGFHSLIVEWMLD